MVDIRSLHTFHSPARHPLLLSAHDTLKMHQGERVALGNKLRPLPHSPQCPLYCPEACMHALMRESK